MSDDREPGGFKVTDRRRFATGDDTEADAPRTKGAQDAPGPESVTFVSFVMGLSAQALVHLGEVADPSGQPPAPDLEAAQHMIDILAVLESKTAGNLTPEEARLLEDMLYDLRIRYVTIAKHPGGSPGKETP